MNPLLAVESIGKSFGTRIVLRTASMWAHPSRITVLLGRNGCGKTTLVKITVGLLRADYGVVIYRGLRSLKPRLHRLARTGLYYLPERNLLSSAFTLREHLRAVNRLVPESDVEGAVELLRLGEFIDRKPRSLSGGELRRAEIAIALARRPICLLADEPYMGIMPTDTELITRAFRELAGEGCAVLVTGHEVRTLLELADDVIWQTGGTTHHIGTPDQAQLHHEFRRDYLGPGFAANRGSPEPGGGSRE
ncbi:MAG: ATP-binding cassette domain-containing protein [Gemmatimonadota bacterium]|nr:MAG: ATP-binding cassette domain-containing protein [Gemmatimonadota bacterium]